MSIVAGVESKLDPRDQPIRIVVPKIEFDVVSPKPNTSSLGIGFAKIEGYSVTTLVIVIVRREICFRAEISAAEAARRVSGKAVYNLTEIASRRVVARPLAAGVAPKREWPSPVF